MLFTGRPLGFGVVDTDDLQVFGEKEISFNGIGILFPGKPKRSQRVFRASCEAPR